MTLFDRILNKFGLCRITEPEYKVVKKIENENELSFSIMLSTSVASDGKTLEVQVKDVMLAAFDENSKGFIESYPPEVTQDLIVKLLAASSEFVQQSNPDMFNQAKLPLNDDGGFKKSDVNTNKLMN